MAIFWKNLISSGQLRLSRLLALALAILAAAAWAAAGGSSSPSMIPAMIGGACRRNCLVHRLHGSRGDARRLAQRLLHLDLIKTYPVPGWSVVLGEVMAPAAILACTEWFLLVLAVSFLPGLGDHALSAYQRVVFGISAAFLLPCFSLLGVLIQNAAALLMPGWIHLGKDHQQGIEAMGQRLITAGVTGAGSASRGDTRCDSVLRGFPERLLAHRLGHHSDCGPGGRDRAVDRSGGRHRLAGPCVR